MKTKKIEKQKKVCKEIQKAEILQKEFNSLIKKACLNIDLDILCTYGLSVAENVRLKEIYLLLPGIKYKWK